MADGVGVIADIRQRGLNEDVKPLLHAPFQQDRSGFVRFVSFVAGRTTPASVAEAIRAEIRDVAPDREHGDDDDAVVASVAQAAFPDVDDGAVRGTHADPDLRSLRIDGLRGDATAREIGMRMAPNAATCSASC